MTVIICLIGTHLKRPFDGIRFWSKRQGITKLYLLYSNVEAEDETAIFSYMSRKNAEELKKRLDVMEPVMIGFDPMDQRDVFKKIYGILSKARKDGEEVLIDITSTTNLTQGIALTIALMFRNARVYTVPSKQPAWYVAGRVGDTRFEEWFENARNQPSLDPTEIKLPGYRLEPRTKHEEREWEVEKRIVRLLKDNRGSAESVSDIIRWLGYKAASSTLRNRFSRYISRLEMRGLVESEKGSKMKAIHLTEFGSIFAEALAEDATV
ncbi:MAG: HFX_2341 family transcriptional regulator domain-containing protein [Candidatus Bathyarchaeia archaeon]